MNDDFKVSDYIVGLLPFPIDDSIIQSVLFQREASDVTVTHISDLGAKNRDLILADIYTIMADGAYDYSQKVSVGGTGRTISMSRLSEKERVSMKNKANALYKKWGETDSIEQPLSVTNI